MINWTGRSIQAPPRSAPCSTKPGSGQPRRALSRPSARPLPTAARTRSTASRRRRRRRPAAPQPNAPPGKPAARSQRVSEAVPACTNPQQPADRRVCPQCAFRSAPCARRLPSAQRTRSAARTPSTASARWLREPSATRQTPMHARRWRYAPRRASRLDEAGNADGRSRRRFVRSATFPALAARSRRSASRLARRAPRPKGRAGGWVERSFSPTRHRCVHPTYRHRGFPFIKQTSPTRQRPVSLIVDFLTTTCPADREEPALEPYDSVPS